MEVKLEVSAERHTSRGRRKKEGQHRICKTDELQEVSALTVPGRRGAGHPVSLLSRPKEALGDLVALRHLATSRP